MTKKDVLPRPFTTSSPFTPFACVTQGPGELEIALLPSYDVKLKSTLERRRLLPGNSTLVKAHLTIAPSMRQHLVHLCVQGYFHVSKLFEIWRRCICDCNKEVLLSYDRSVVSALSSPLNSLWNSLHPFRYIGYFPAYMQWCAVTDLFTTEWKSHEAFYIENCQGW